MRGLCTLGIIAVPLVLAAVWVSIDAFRASWPVIAGTPNLPETLPVGTRVLGFIISMISGNPPGERSLSISLGSYDLQAAFVGLLLLVIAWIMGEAAGLAEDHAQIV